MTDNPDYDLAHLKRLDETRGRPTAEPAGLAWLDELERLEKAATEAPWRQGVEYDEETGEEVGSLSIHGPNYEQKWRDETQEVSDTIAVLGFSAHTRHRANLKYITELRNHAAQLIEIARAAEDLANCFDLIESKASEFQLEYERLRKALEVRDAQ